MVHRLSAAVPKSWRCGAALAAAAWLVAAVPAVAYEVPLAAGWNLVSLPEEPVDPTVEGVMGPVQAGLLAVWTYRDGRWLCYAPAVPELSDLTVLRGGEGYWIRLSVAGTLTGRGLATTVSTALQPGWNLVGSNGFVAAPPGVALAGAGDAATAVWTYDGVSGAWRSFATATAGPVSGSAALAAVTSGGGYWVRATDGVVWDNPSYTEPVPVVPPADTPESTSVTTPAGEPTTLALSDGSGTDLPALAAEATVTFARETERTDMATWGVGATGSRRMLTVDTAEAPYDAVPTIRIPRSEIGTINPDTINVVRVGDIVSDNQIVRDAVLSLPVSTDAAGNIVVRDLFFGDSAAAAALDQAGRATPSTRVRYEVTTFQGNLNWSRKSVLQRMIPDTKAAAKRKRVEQLTADEKKALDLKPVQNVVVLVHGHNEVEKGGLPATLAGAAPEELAPTPWLVVYKRDVWTYLYDEFLRKDGEGKPVYGDLAECTRFYEFVYPSWQAIFSKLGPDMASLIADALRPQLKGGCHVNLFVVAHSMGGLVARAGLQELAAPLDTDFQKLATWGSPHRGAALYTTCALAHANPPYKALYLTEAGRFGWNSIRTGLAATALDTPGMRDIRWDNARPLALLDYFRLSEAQIMDDPLTQLFDLRSGPWLYNRNLQVLNASDRYAKLFSATNKLGRPHYAFMYGVTSKYALRPEVALTPVQVYGYLHFLSPGTLNTADIAAGATANRWLIADPDATLGSTTLKLSDSDGAVHVSSMTGEGLAVQTVYLGDTDHEEYYGAPAGGTPRTPEKAQETAQLTFQTLEFQDPVYACPHIDVTQPAASSLLAPDGDGRVAMAGKLTWPGENEPVAFRTNPLKRVKKVGNGPRVGLVALDTAMDWLRDLSGPVPAGAMAAIGYRYYRTMPVYWLDSLAAPSSPDPGAFTGSALCPSATTTGGLRILMQFADGTEMTGDVLLEFPQPLETRSAPYSITWGVPEVTRIFYHQYNGGDLYTHYSGDYPTAGTALNLTAVLAAPGALAPDDLCFVTVRMFDEETHILRLQGSDFPYTLTHSATFTGYDIRVESIPGVGPAYVSYDTVSIGFSGPNFNMFVGLAPGGRPPEAYPPLPGRGGEPASGPPTVHERPLPRALVSEEGR